MRLKDLKKQTEQLTSSNSEALEVLDNTDKLKRLSSRESGPRQANGEQHIDFTLMSNAASGQISGRKASNSPDAKRDLKAAIRPQETITVLENNE